MKTGGVQEKLPPEMGVKVQPRHLLQQISKNQHFERSCYACAHCVHPTSSVAMAALRMGCVPSTSSVLLSCSALPEYTTALQKANCEQSAQESLWPSEHRHALFSCCFHAQRCRFKVRLCHRRAGASQQRQAATWGPRQGLPRPAHNFWRRFATPSASPMLAQGIAKALLFLISFRTSLEVRLPACL